MWSTSLANRVVMTSGCSSREKFSITWTAHTDVEWRQTRKWTGKTAALVRFQHPPDCRCSDGVPKKRSVVDAKAQNH
jgi:hypothetical protein